MTRLNVGKVVVGAFVIPWLNKRAFAKALFIPLLLMVCLTLSWDYAVEHLPTAAKWGLYILYFSLFVVMAVTCHRLILLDTREISPQYKISWSARETRFFGWAIAISCVFTVVAALAGLLLVVPGQWMSEPNAKLPKWVSFAAQAPAFYVFARCSLVFPAIAINRQVNFKWAWNLSKENGWRLVMLVAVLPWLISHALDFLYRDNATFIETILLTLLGYTFLAVEIAAISLAYRELVKGEGNDMLAPNLPLEPEEHAR